MTPTSPTNPVDDLTPILDPLRKLLKSRKAIIAIITAILDTLVLFVPAIAPQRDALLAIFTGLAGVLITAITSEDNTKTKAAATVQAAKHQADAVVAASKAPTPPLSTPEGTPKPFTASQAREWNEKNMGSTSEGTPPRASGVTVASQWNADAPTPPSVLTTNVSPGTPPTYVDANS